MFDAGASFDLARVSTTPVIVRLNIENVFDKNYYKGVSFGGFGLSLGDPRIVKLSAAVSF